MGYMKTIVAEAVRKLEKSGHAVRVIQTKPARMSYVVLETHEDGFVVTEAKIEVYREVTRVNEETRERDKVVELRKVYLHDTVRTGYVLWESGLVIILEPINKGEIADGNEEARGGGGAAGVQAGDDSERGEVPGRGPSREDERW